MNFFWFFVFVSQPISLFLSVFGLLGKDAKKAADDFSGTVVVIVVLAIIGYLIFLLLKWIGVVQ